MRERIIDIPLLVQAFLEENFQQTREKSKKITEAALGLLTRYDWPGNVRELKNLVERLAIMVAKNIIDVEDLPAPYHLETLTDVQSPLEDLIAMEGFKDARAAFEKTFIQSKLRENDENITRTAEAIGVDRSYLHKRLKRFGEYE